MSPTDTDHTDDVPEQIKRLLEDSSDSQLREIIHYAQQRLQEHPSLTDEIESRQGEELVRMEDHGAYSIVILERPDETGEARGPFAYRVKWVPNIGDDEGQYRWHYLGKVSDENEYTHDG